MKELMLGFRLLKLRQDHDLTQNSYANSLISAVLPILIMKQEAECQTLLL